MRALPLQAQLVRMRADGMSGSTTPEVTESLAGTASGRFALSGAGRALLCAIGVTWVTAVAMAVGGTPAVLGELIEVMGASMAWLAAAAVITLGLLVAVALDRRAVRAGNMRDLLAQALEAFPYGVQIKDTELRYVWMNPAHTRRVGFRPEAWLGKRPDEIGIEPALAVAAMAHDRRVLAAGEAEGPEEQVFRDSEGNIEHVALVTKVPLLRDGKVGHILTVGVEVTDLQRARAAAEEARRQLLAVVDNVPVGLQVKGADGRFRWVNRAFERLYGVDGAAIVGKRVDELSRDPAVIDEALRHDREVIASGTVLGPYENDFYSAAGEWHRMLVSKVPLHDADGRVAEIMTVGVDITARKRAESALEKLNTELEQRVAQRSAELAKSSGLVATVVQSAPVPIVVFDRQGRITAWNPAAERLTGYTAAEANAAQAVARDEQGQSQFAEMAQRIRRGESFSGIDARRRAKDGREIELLISGAPLVGADGAIDGAVGIWLDVTAQRAMERQLRQAQKMEAIGQLTGGVAHDFNNLLAVVIGNLELLSDRTGDDARMQRIVQEAINAAERGAGLTRRLLAFARRQALSPTATDVNALVAGMAPLLQRALGETVAVEFATAAGLWPALVDASQLENAILNLSINARDAMPSGGKLRISTANAVLDRDYTGQHAEVAPGDYVSICVSDTGTGIAPEILDQVFEPFFTTKEVGKGSGLGLSMVFGFVKQSGGHVRIYSEPGLGTSVTLYLPRVAGAGMASADAATRAVSPGRGETILLVEDNEQLRETAAGMLTALGYRVVGAGEAQAALVLLDAHPEIRLLFSDVVLPGGVNGFELAREARRRRPGLPVVFASGFVDPSMVQDSGFAEDILLLGKPFRRAELAEKVRAGLMPRGRAMMPD
jgi:PAS domain S-box-containing protein